MPTIGEFRCRSPVLPRNVASPKVKIPPSPATIQYPPPDGVAVIPTTGWLSRIPPVEPWKLADPKLNTPPSAPNSQYPLAHGTGPAGLAHATAADPIVCSWL